MKKTYETMENNLHNTRVRLLISAHQCLITSRQADNAWKGFCVAVTVLVAIAIIFNVLFKKKDKPAVVDQAIQTVEQAVHE